MTTIKKDTFLRFCFTLVLWTFVICLNGQSVYEVDIDNRNEAIELNETARKNLEEGQVDMAIDHIFKSISIDSLL